MFYFKMFSLVILSFVFSIPSNASSIFDFEAAGKKINNIKSMNLLMVNSSYRLYQLQQEVISLVERADDCIKHKKKDLKEIEKLVGHLNKISQDKQLSKTDFLNLQQKQYIKELNQCFYYKFYAEKLVEKINTAIFNRSEMILRHQSTPFWQLSFKTLLEPPKLFNDKHKEANNILNFYGLYLLLVLLLFALHKNSNVYPEVLTKLNLDWLLIDRMFYSLLLLFLSVILFYIIKPILEFNDVQNFIAYIVLSSLFLIGLKKILLNQGEKFTKKGLNSQFYLTLVKYCMDSFIFIGIVLYSTGLWSLSFYLTQAIFHTIVLCILFGVVIYVVKNIFKYIFESNESMAFLHNWIFFESTEKIFELKLIKALSYIYVLYYFISLLIIIWDITHLTHLWLHEIYFYGFKVANVIFVPDHIINAVIMYCVLCLLVRFIACQKSKRELSKKNSIQLDDSINPIVMHICFVLVGLFSVFIAGVNLTGLAIVAGALSVGIGFSLKSIINNFVAGIILLFEKPIKVGDRIKVDEYEGVVSKINIRATEIQTRDRSDVLIPNEKIITHEVINYMLVRPIWRVKCEVNVSNQNDVELVKELLLEVIKESNEVIQDDPRHLPEVLFKQISNAEYLFELRAIIKHVNQKNTVRSEFNCAIARKFEQHGIKTAKTQLELLSKT